MGVAPAAWNEGNRLAHRGASRHHIVYDQQPALTGAPTSVPPFAMVLATAPFSL